VRRTRRQGAENDDGNNRMGSHSSSPGMSLDASVSASCVSGND
jgi:hypothetical protein